jgi:hypothetical protein
MSIRCTERIQKSVADRCSLNSQSLAPTKEFKRWQIFLNKICHIASILFGRFNIFILDVFLNCLLLQFFSDLISVIKLRTKMVDAPGNSLNEYFGILIA